MGQVVSGDSIVVVAEGQVSCELVDEVAILALQSGLYYGLNAVGSRVWELIQEPAAVREVSAILVDEYEVAPERCEQELVVLLQDLASKGLVTVHEAADV